MRRLIVLVVGLTILLIGAVTIILPAPTTLILILGLALLATEFVWAQLTLVWLKHRAALAARQMRSFGLRRPGAETPPSTAASSMTN